MRDGNRDGGMRGGGGGGMRGNGGGRGGRGGGRGGRGGRGGGGGFRGRGRGGRGRGGHGRDGDRGDLLRSAESGNRRERIAVESGYLVMIDQFMLANPQFIGALTQIIDEAPARKDEVIAKFGGCVVEVEPGTYRIERDPFALAIVIHPEGEEITIDRVTAKRVEPKGQLFVDTRCLAMIDRELLDDASLLEKYQQLWFGGQDKACRDLIRDNGGAVRYGFQRGGDELVISKVSEENIVCLWPEGGPVKQPERPQHSEQEGEFRGRGSNNTDDRGAESSEGTEGDEPMMSDNP